MERRAACLLALVGWCAGYRQSPAPLRVTAFRRHQPFTRAAIQMKLVKNEMPRTIDAATLFARQSRGGKKTIRMEATEAELAAVSKRFDLQRIEYLFANVTLRAVAGQENTVLANGVINASVVFPAAAKNDPEPAPMPIPASFKTLLKLGGGAAFDDEDDDEDDDMFEASLEDQYQDIEEVPYGGECDLGELVVQYLFLSMPRR